MSLFCMYFSTTEFIQKYLIRNRLTSNNSLFHLMIYLTVSSYHWALRSSINHRVCVSGTYLKSILVSQFTLYTQELQKEPLPAQLLKGMQIVCYKLYEGFIPIKARLLKAQGIIFMDTCYFIAFFKKGSLQELLN